MKHRISKYSTTHLLNSHRSCYGAILEDFIHHSVHYKSGYICSTVEAAEYAIHLDAILSATKISQKNNRH